MKKHILAASIAGAFGAVTMMSGVANAATEVAANGIGLVNIVPYFTTQGSQVTQIHIINTDTVNGKAIKVRFRGAEWSDDVYDFTAFLSPNDVFTGAVKVNASGVSAFETTDTTCTHTINVNKAFPTSRVSNGAAGGTREGYVEVITMGDIPPTSNPLFTAIKHVRQSDGTYKPPCRTATTGASFDMFKSDDTSTLRPNVDTEIDSAVTKVSNVSGSNVFGTLVDQATWMTAPTGTVTTWSRVIDVETVKSYNNTATALTTTAARLSFFTQSVSAVTPVDTMTQDMIFWTASTANTLSTAAGTPLTQMYLYDMPDLSTPIDDAGGITNASQQLASTLTALRKDAVISEYVTATDVGGSTDIVLTQPIRRYYYTYQTCTATSCATEGTNYSRMVGTNKYIVTGVAASPYADLKVSNRIELAGITASMLPLSMPATSAVAVYDREERYETATSSIVVSPQEPTVVSLSLKGEVSVVSVNLGTSATQTTALGAKLTMNDISQAGYDRGWMTLSTIAKRAAGDLSLPIIGFTAMQVSGAYKYGNAVPLRYIPTATP